MINKKKVLSVYLYFVSAKTHTLRKNVKGISTNISNSTTSNFIDGL